MWQIYLQHHCSQQRTYWWPKRYAEPRHLWAWYCFKTEPYMVWVRGFRPFWVFILSQCTRARTNRKLQSIGRGHGDWMYCFPTCPNALWQQKRTDRSWYVPMHCDNKNEQIGLNTDCNITFLISPVNINILHFKEEYGARSKSRFACYSRCYVTWCP